MKLAFFLFQGVDINGQGLNAVPVLIANLIDLAMFFAGALSIIYIIIGGIRYVTSVGNPQSIAGAKRTLTYAIGGLLLAMSAILIVNFVYGAGSFLRK